MMTSIAHRASGVFMAAGALLLACWLLAIESGPENYATFYMLIISPVGQVVLWLIVWCYVYHLLNGIRHLFWDFGHGFELATANITGVLVILLSAAITVALLLVILGGYGGYYDTL